MSLRPVSLFVLVALLLSTFATVAPTAHTTAAPATRTTLPAPVQAVMPIEMEPAPEVQASVTRPLPRRPASPCARLEPTKGRERKSLHSTRAANGCLLSMRLVRSRFWMRATHPTSPSSVPSRPPPSCRPTAVHPTVSPSRTAWWRLPLKTVRFARIAVQCCSTTPTARC